MAEAEERCERTELLKSGCAHCKEIAAADWADEGAVWEALYPGRCPTCSYTFNAGTRLKWAANGEPEHAYHAYHQ